MLELWQAEPVLADWLVSAESVDAARREITVRVSVTPAEGRSIGVNSVVAHRPGVEPGGNEQWPWAYDFKKLNDGILTGSLTLP